MLLPTLLTYTGEPLPKPIQCSYIVCNTNSDTTSTPENVLPEDLGVVIMLNQSAEYGERLRRTLWDYKAGPALEGEEVGGRARGTADCLSSHLTPNEQGGREGTSCSPTWKSPPAPLKKWSSCGCLWAHWCSPGENRKGGSRKNFLNLTSNAKGGASRKCGHSATLKLPESRGNFYRTRQLLAPGPEIHANLQQYVTQAVTWTYGINKCGTRYLTHC